MTPLHAAPGRGPFPSREKFFVLTVMFFFDHIAVVVVSALKQSINQSINQIKSNQSIK